MFKPEAGRLKADNAAHTLPIPDGRMTSPTGTPADPVDFTALDALKARLDALRPLPAAALRNLHEALVLRWTYHSNAIEGNTLTLMETKVVLEGITVGGKLLREHFEAINHRDAILYVEDVVRREEPLSEWQIRNLHRLVLRQIDDENAGRYRQLNVTIAGARHVPPDLLQVPEQMAALLRWYDTEAVELHPVERAARLHVDFVKIHPFVDGNGRTARLLLNLELLKAGFPAIVLPVEHRLAYYEALDKAHVTGEMSDFLALVARCVHEGFAPYWHVLGLSPSV
jgi:Fic family protein